MTLKKSKPYEPRGFSGDMVEVLFLEIPLYNVWSNEICAANNIFMSLLEEGGEITSAIYSIVTYVPKKIELPIDTSYIEGLRPGGKYREELYKILDKTSPKIVAMSLMTSMYNRGVMTAKAIKEYDPCIKIIVGGIQPTFAPEQALKDGFDYIFRGDGYQTLVENIKSILTGREPEKIIVSPKPFIDNPDDLPFAHPNAYNNRKFISGGSPKTLIYTSYGCNNVCKFCAGRIVYRKMRRKVQSPERVLDEMQWQISQYGKDYLEEAGKCYFFFGDANAVQDTEDDLKRMLTIIDLIEKRGLQVTMDLELRADIIRETYKVGKEVLEKLFRYSFSTAFGVESLSGDNLKTYKQLNLMDIKEACKALNDINILPCMFFIIGYEQDTRETIIENMKRLREMAGEHAILPTFILTPDPGSPLYDEFERKGKITNTNLDYYDHHNLVWKHPHFNPVELKNLYLEVKEKYELPEWVLERRRRA